ncbi:MAG: hypothetical protein R3Y46_04860 [Opitutales bacterium]
MSSRLIARSKTPRRNSWSFLASIAVDSVFQWTVDNGLNSLEQWFSSRP